MAFASMFILAVVTIFVILLLIFLFGLIVFIIGIANSRKIKRDKKKWPVVLMVIGALNMIPPVIIAVVLIILASVYNYRVEHMLDIYGTIPEAWKNVETVDQNAGKQALSMLLKAADDNDRDAFIECFSEETRSRDDFEDVVDAFFEAYPGGFSETEFSYNAHGGQNSINGGKGAVHGYEGEVDGEFYYITLGYCYWNDDHPESVGVNKLLIMTVAGDAGYNAGLTDINPDNEDIYILCYFPGPDEVNARRINRYTYLWEETDGPVLTADEMREYLSGFETLQEAIDGGGIGRPNSNPVYRGGVVSNEYYYELQPVNGEPRYAHIRTSGPYGRIIQAVECTPDGADYDNMIKD